MLVVYSNDGEVLVCEKKDEKKLLDTYFGPDNRSLDEYDREENEVVEIRNRMLVSVDKV